MTPAELIKNLGKLQKKTNYFLKSAIPDFKM